MSATTYEDPPVSEVLIDLQFADGISPTQLLDFPDLAAGAFGEPHPLRRQMFETFSSAVRSATAEPKAGFFGWDFLEESPRRLVAVSANQITLHYVREGDWPEGRYAGWESNFARFCELLGVARQPFREVKISRAGLRYENRITIPKESLVQDWFTFVPEQWSFMQELRHFSVARMWERDEDLGLSATVELRGDLPLKNGEAGTSEGYRVALSIDVFNFWVDDAPSLEGAEEWMSNAHTLVIRLFEESITPRLREKFSHMAGATSADQGLGRT